MASLSDCAANRRHVGCLATRARVATKKVELWEWSVEGTGWRRLSAQRCAALLKRRESGKL